MTHDEAMRIGLEQIVAGAPPHRPTPAEWDKQRHAEDREPFARALA